MKHKKKNWVINSTWNNYEFKMTIYCKSLKRGGCVPCISFKLLGLCAPLYSSKYLVISSSFWFFSSIILRLTAFCDGDATTIGRFPFSGRYSTTCLPVLSANSWWVSYKLISAYIAPPSFPYQWK